MAEPIVLEKRCCRCKQIKSANEYHRLASQPDGLQKRCKECAAETNHRYGQSATGKAKRRAIYRAWTKTQNGRAATQRRWLKIKGTDAYKARLAVSSAINGGRLPRADTLRCKHCGNQAEEYHHHRGYAPKHYLHVIPLCVPCHWLADHPLGIQTKLC